QTPVSAKPRRRGGGFLVVAAVVVLAGLAGAIGAYAIPKFLSSKPAKPAMPDPSSTVAQPRPAPRAVIPHQTAPYVQRRQLVYFRSTHPPGTIVVSKSHGFLYHLRSDKSAARYSVGIAGTCSRAVGLLRVSQKQEDASGADGAAGDHEPALRRSL